MMKKAAFSLFALLLLTSCSSLIVSDGQVVYHWERPHTGIEKFSRDHTYCMREAEAFKVMPRIKTLFYNMFYSEEKKLEVRSDWDSDRGIWASYVPYPGAQPIMLNSLRDDYDSSPRKYSSCMKQLGYTQRNYQIPEITNINLHRSN